MVGTKNLRSFNHQLRRNSRLIPVFAPGDPADLGFAIGAITDQSIYLGTRMAFNSS